MRVRIWNQLDYISTGLAMRLNRWLAHLLRFFFKHLYTTLAWTYDFVAWSTSMGQWKTWQSAAMQGLPEGLILELGHGPGHLLLDLLRTGHEAVGLDSSRQMTHLTARRLRKHGYPTQILRAHAQHIPLADETFTCVLSTFPSEYILDPMTLKEIWRVLKPGGQAVIIGVERITGRGIHDRFASWLYHITGQAGDPHDDWSRPLQPLGFTANLERMRQPRAIVLRFVVRKHALKGS